MAESRSPSGQRRTLRRPPAGTAITVGTPAASPANAAAVTPLISTNDRAGPSERVTSRDGGAVAVDVAEGAAVAA